MTNDLISRQEAIDGILQFMPTKLRDDATLEEQINYVAWRCALGCAVSSVGTQPSAQPEQRWIPVTERLPELGIDVLTVDGYGDYEINHIIDEDGEWYWEPPVTAWMPLPEPWKGETDE